MNNNNNNNTNAEVGVIVGKFQTPFLHEGHLEIINHVASIHPRVIIFVGQAQFKCTINNTLDFNARRFMIEEKFPDIEVHRIDDVGDDEIWSRDLDRHIKLLVGPNQNVILYGSRDSFVSKYEGKFKTIELKPSRYISATELRKIAGIKSRRTGDFRVGAFWVTQNQYPKVYPTVDIAVVDLKKNALLLGRKSSNSLWRFPGGFSDTIDSSFEDSARRELVEETCLCADKVQYIGSIAIDDPRYRGEVDKIKTLFFVVTEWDGEATAADDLVEVKWFPLDSVRHDQLEPYHGVLLNMLNDWKCSRFAV